MGGQRAQVDTFTSRRALGGGLWEGGFGRGALGGGLWEGGFNLQQLHIPLGNNHHYSLRFRVQKGKQVLMHYFDTSLSGHSLSMYLRGGGARGGSLITGGHGQTHHSVIPIA
jgi:hypothetical protein